MDNREISERIISNIIDHEFGTGAYAKIEDSAPAVQIVLSDISRRAWEKYQEEKCQNILNVSVGR